MCRFSFKNNVSFVAVRSRKFRNKLDYYFILPGRGYEYAFTKDFKVSCWEMYKKPTSLNKAIRSKCNNIALMHLRKYLHYMLPYLVDYLDLKNYLVSDGKKEHRRHLAA